jgi:hypothetical protein
MGPIHRGTWVVIAGDVPRDLRFCPCERLDRYDLSVRDLAAA